MCHDFLPAHKFSMVMRSHMAQGAKSIINILGSTRIRFESVYYHGLKGFLKFQDLNRVVRSYLAC